MTTLILIRCGWEVFHGTNVFSSFFLARSVFFRVGRTRYHLDVGENLFQFLVSYSNTLCSGYFLDFASLRLFLVSVSFVEERVCVADI